MSVLFWAVLSDAWGYSEHFLTNLPNNWNQYIYGYVSRFIWAMPFLFLIIRERQRNTTLTKEIFKFHIHWKSFLLVFVISTIYILCGMVVTHGDWWFNPNIIFLQELFKFLIVGFTEELVYRGFGFHILSTYMNARKANIISNLFFTALHLPAYFIHWYCDHTFSLKEMLTQAAGVFILGLIFGIVFKKSKSIWPSAIIHFWYDFTFIILIG